MKFLPLLQYYKVFKTIVKTLYYGLGIVLSRLERKHLGTNIERTNAEAETPILWPPDAKNWLIWKDPDAGEDWKREEKGMTEDEMVV